MNMERTQRGLTFLHHSLRLAGSFFAAAILTILSQPSWGQGYQVTQLNPPGAKVGTTYAFGVNKVHSVVGMYVVKSTGATVGFLYSAGKYTVINPPSANGFARANGINDSGTIVGDFLTSDGRYHGFTYSGGTYTTYDETTTESCGIFGINSAGNFGGDVGNGPARGFVNVGGKKSEFYATGTDSTYVYGINLGGEAVGTYYDSSNKPHGFHRSATGTITNISYPGAASTMVTGINDAGEITGSYTTSSGQSHGFTDTKGTFVTTDFIGTYGIASDATYVGIYIGVDGVQFGYVAIPHMFTLTKGTIANSTQGAFWGINNASVVVGTYADLKGTSHGMMISGAVVTNIDDPKGPTLCRAINSNNEIVGDYFDTSGNPHGFLYSGGTFTDIPGPTNAVVSEATGINDAGVISGDYWDTVTQTFHGFILKSGTYKTLDPPGTIETFGGGINASDDVVLWWHDKAKYRQSSLYNGTTYASLDVPGATNSLAYGINKTNQVAFVWTDSYGAKHGAVKEGAAYYIFDFPKGNTTGATGINDLGEFVGSYIPAGKTTDEPLEGK